MLSTTQRWPRLRRGSLLYGALLATFAPTTALASAAEANDEESMIVTAHRIPMAQTRVGSTVSTVTATELEQRQAIFATDVLQDTPGVAVSRTAGYGSFTQVRIRGAEANQALVIIDGVEANDPASGDEFAFTSLLGYDVERVEILRGPQSALWGSDATAGVINITTRRGEPGLNGGAFLEHGSQSTYFGGGNVSFNGERAGISANGAYYDTDGDSAAAAGSEDDGYENVQMSLTAHYEPTEASELRFFTRYSDGTTEFDATDFSTGLPADADNESDNELLLTGVAGNLSTFDGVWTHDLRLTYLDSDNEQSQDGVEVSSTSAEKVGIYYQSTFALPTWGTLQDQRLIVAVDYEDTDFEQRGEESFPGFDPNQDQNIDITGYVAEYLVEPLDGLNLSAGIRYDDASDFDNVSTYRLTASYLYQPTGTRFHGSAGKSQKAPTFTERFGFFPGQFIGNPDLEPEENRGFDVGVEQRLLDDRVRVDVTYFRERLENEIDGFVFDAENGAFTAGNLGQRSRRDGVEVELDSELTANLSLGLTYSYTDSREPDGSGGRSRELRRPKHMASGNLNGRFLGGRANVNLNVSHTSNQRDNFFPPFPEPSQVVKLGSYTLVNLTSSYRLSDNVELYARVENLGDENYENVLGFNSPERLFFAGFRVSL